VRIPFLTSVRNSIPPHIWVFSRKGPLFPMKQTLFVTHRKPYSGTVLFRLNN
jgi:hypothetical protein